MILVAFVLLKINFGYITYQDRNLSISFIQKTALVNLM